MERDNSFDNYKAFLIILVVVGHFLNPLTESVPWTEYVRKAIFMFHMPAFIFISGYFARKNDWKKLVQKLLIPYLLMQVIVWGVRLIFHLPGREFTFIKPYFTLWFLPCLFVWRLIIEKANRIKGILPAAFLAGILAGFFGFIGENFSLSRLICFFPYFLLGYRFDKDAFMEYAKKRRVKVMAVAGIVMIFLLLAVTEELLPMRSFLFRGSYIKGGGVTAAAFTGAGIRILLYIAGTVLTYLFMAIMPAGKHWFSSLGRNTMSVYLFHGILLQFFEQSSLLTHCQNDIGAIAVIVGSVGLAFLLATKPFVWVVEKL